MSTIFVFTGYPEAHRAHEDTILIDGAGVFQKGLPLGVAPDSAPALRCRPHLFREVTAEDAERLRAAYLNPKPAAKPAAPAPITREAETPAADVTPTPAPRARTGK